MLRGLLNDPAVSSVKPKQPQAQLAKIIPVRAGRKFTRATECIGRLLPQRGIDHVQWQVHGAPPSWGITNAVSYCVCPVANSKSQDNENKLGHRWIRTRGVKYGQYLN